MLKFLKFLLHPGLSPMAIPRTLDCCTVHVVPAETLVCRWPTVKLADTSTASQTSCSVWSQRKDHSSYGKPLCVSNDKMFDKILFLLIIVAFVNLKKKRKIITE